QVHLGIQISISQFKIPVFPIIPKSQVSSESLQFSDIIRLKRFGVIDYCPINKIINITIKNIGFQRPAVIYVLITYFKLISSFRFNKLISDISGLVEIQIVKRRNTLS